MIMIHENTWRSLSDELQQHNEITQKQTNKNYHVIPYKTNKEMVGQHTNKNVRLFHIKFDHQSYK